MQVKDVRIIKRLMAVENISARQLATGIGYASHSYVNRILSGKVTTVTPARGRNIARFLKVDVEDIFVDPTSTAARRSDTRQVS